MEQKGKRESGQVQLQQPPSSFFWVEVDSATSIPRGFLSTVTDVGSFFAIVNKFSEISRETGEKGREPMAMKSSFTF